MTAHRIAQTLRNIADQLSTLGKPHTILNLTCKMLAQAVKTRTSNTEGGRRSPVNERRTVRTQAQVAIGDAVNI